MPNGETATSSTTYDPASGCLTGTTVSYDADTGGVQNNTTSISYTAESESVMGVGSSIAYPGTLVSPAGTVTHTYTTQAKNVSVTGGTITLQVPTSETISDGLVNTVNTYNLRHQLQTTTLPSGATVSLGYSGNFLSSISVPGLNPMSFTWTSNRVSQYTDVNNVVHTYGYDLFDRVTTFTKGSYTGYNFYNRLDLIGQQDFMGATSGFAYDSMDRLVASTNRNGYVTTYGYCPCGALSTVTDPDNSITSYTLDPGSRITAITQMGTGNQTYYTSLFLDSVGRVSGARLPDNENVTNTLNMQGEVCETFVSGQSVRQKHYNPLGQVTQVVDTSDSAHATPTVAVVYDGFNRPKSATLNSSTLWTRNYTGPFLTSVADADGHITKYGYDALGRMNCVTNALQGSIGWVYNALGKLAYRTNENGGIKGYSYDPYGRVGGVVEEGNAAAQTYGYDGDDRLTTIVPAGGSPISLTYDHDGNVQTKGYYLPNNNYYTVRYGYDRLDRLSVMRDSLGSSSGFTYKDFGAFRSSLASESTPAGVTVGYSYDTAGRLQTVSAGTFSTTYGYDALSRAGTVSSPAGSIGLQYFGSSGRAQTLQFPGNVTRSYTYTPDALVQSVVIASGQTTLDSYNYTYDPNPTGRRLTMARPSNTVSYGYDALGQLLGATGADAGGAGRLNETFAYAYDAAGNMTNVVSGIEPLAAHLHLRYSGANELLGVPEMDNEIICGTLDTEPASLQGTFASANISTNYSFSPNADQTFGAFVPLTQPNRTVNDSASASITAYDGNGHATYASQFTANNVNAGHRSVTYDGTSLRLNLTQDAQNNYVYDALGQPYSVNGQGYRYDGLGRLISYTELDGSTTKLVYAGRRVIQELNGTQTVSYTLGQTVSALNNSGGIGGLLARTDSAGTAYYHEDGNGNVVDMTDANGALVATYLYEPYGQLIGAWGKLSQTNLYRFSSERYNVASGAYFYLYRMYSPELRRWVNQDPIGEAGGMNLYGFVGNSPVNYVDPYGLYDWSDYIRDYAAGWQMVKDAGSWAERLFTGAPGDMVPNDGYTGYRGGSQMTDPLAKDAKGNDATADVMFNLGTTVAMAAIGGPEGEGGELLGGAIKCENASRGFKSFEDLKKFLGSPGEGNVWHHIVEQSKVDKFGAHAIHNVDNVIAIPDKLNSDLNALYSSIRPDITGSNMTVRDWLSTKSLQQNYDFGVAALYYLSTGKW
jgi:RHS repeat-associated protein